MTIVLKTLDGCSVRFDDDDPSADVSPPLATYMLPLKTGGHRCYDFAGSMRDEDGVVVRCYEERDPRQSGARFAVVTPSGRTLQRTT